MAILLTGGPSAQTSVHIAKQCTNSKIPFILASRRGGSPNSSTSESESFPTVKFDWTDPSTYPNPFSYTFPNNEKITALYMIIPRTQEPEKHMIAFIEYAISRGVKRFVLMAGTTAERGGYGPGQVWKYLADRAEGGDPVEYAVCRPSWFQDNFISWHLYTIKSEGKFYGSVGDAKIPFINAEDIANVAFVALTRKEAPNRDYRIVGPELLTNAEVAAKLNKALGRRIEYVNLTPEQRQAQLVESGMPAHGAEFLVGLEKLTAGGFETHMNDVVEEVTGKKPKTMDQFIEENKTVFG